MFNLFKRKKILVEITICIEKDENEFYAFCPTLPGFHVGGVTEEEVIQNAKDGFVAYLISLMKHNEPLPMNVVVKEIPANACSYKFTESIPVYV